MRFIFVLLMVAMPAFANTGFEIFYGTYDLVSCTSETPAGGYVNCQWAKILTLRGDSNNGVEIRDYNDEFHFQNNTGGSMNFNEYHFGSSVGEFIPMPVGGSYKISYLDRGEHLQFYVYPSSQGHISFKEEMTLKGQGQTYFFSRTLRLKKR